MLRDILNEPVLPIPPIGKNPFENIKEFSKQKFIPQNEKYVSPTVQGQVTFDYSNNNGRYCIGQDELMFEVCFSKASNHRIHVYNDSESVDKIALIKDCLEIKQIADARIYDFSSRVRTPAIGQIVILQNVNGFYSALKILALKDDTRGDQNDKVSFEYVIQTNGTLSFLI